MGNVYAANVGAHKVRKYLRLRRAKKRKENVAMAEDAGLGTGGPAGVRLECSLPWYHE